MLQERSGGVDQVPVMHPIKDFKIKDKTVAKTMKKIEEITAKLEGNVVFKQEAQEEQAAVEGLKELALERASLQV